MSRPPAAAAATEPEPRGSQSSPETVPDEIRYTEEELSANAHHLLRANRAAVAGGLDGETRKTWTLAEAKKLVDEFLNRPEATS